MTPTVRQIASLSACQRNEAASKCKVGDVWIHRRHDKTKVTIIERIGPQMVRLLQPSGRKTVKQLGNFAEDYFPA